MSGENKRITGAQKLESRPELDIERRPEGGPKPQKRNKAYGMTEPMSDTPAKARKSVGVNPPRRK